MAETWTAFFSVLFPEDIFSSFETLIENYNLPVSDFFKYLQIRSFAKKTFPPFPHLTPRNQLDLILDLDPYDRKRISTVYKMIQGLKEISWDRTKTAWETDLGEELSEEAWQKSLTRVQTSSLCVRHGLIQFRIVHRLHYSNEKLAKIFPTINPGCPRGNNCPASVGHMFWLCPSLNEYWRQILEVFSYICGQTVDPNFHTAIFGIPPPNCKLTNLQENALAFASLLARRLIQIYTVGDQTWADELNTFFCRFQVSAPSPAQAILQQPSLFTLPLPC